MTSHCVENDLMNDLLRFRDKPPLVLALHFLICTARNKPYLAATQNKNTNLRLRLTKDSDSQSNASAK